MLLEARRAPTSSVGLRRPRSLARYLLLPRPKDLGKVLIIPVTFTVGAIGTGGVERTAVARLLVVWLAIELLVYQARYQWNDIRGFAADQRHPESAARGRLPGPASRARTNVLASAVVATLRIAVALALPWLLPGLHVGAVLLGSTAGVLGVASVYEGLRAASTGRSGEVPASLSSTVVGLWIAVGAGYAVRGLTGLAIAVDLGDRLGLAVVAGLAMWAAGIGFVLSRWTLETMAFARLHGDRVTWEAGPAHAREHTLALLRWVSARPDRRDLPPGEPLTRWRALHGSTTLTAPWNLSLLIAAGAAALTGLLLTEPVVGSSWGVGEVVWTLLAVAAAAGVVGAARRRLVVTVAAAAALVAVAGALDGRSPSLRSCRGS